MIRRSNPASTSPAQRLALSSDQQPLAVCVFADILVSIGYDVI